jgi:guanylate kinase
MEKPTGKLLVISGPSAGAGKDTILNMLLGSDSNWHQPPSTTTRQPREGETNGKEYFFVSHDEFEKMQKEGKFLEADFHAENWYGTQKEPVERFLQNGQNVVIRIDVNGALQVKKLLPQAILVFITVENEQELEKRIRARGTEDETEIQKRLQLAKKEMLLKPKFDHVVVNEAGKAEKTLQKVLDITGQ